MHREIKNQIDMEKFKGKPNIPRPLSLEEALSGDVVMNEEGPCDHRVLTIRENTEVSSVVPIDPTPSVTHVYTVIRARCYKA